MSEAVQNRCGCPTPVVTNVPGTAGASACTNITADFSVPAFGNNVTVYVVDNSQMVVGTIVMADAPAHFEVISLTGATQCVLQFVNQSGDVAPGTTITVGAKLCPSAGQGTAGTDGNNGYATTTSNLTVPSIGSNVTAAVDNSACFVVGQYVVAGNSAESPANFIVEAIPTATSLTLTFLGNAGDVSPGTVIASPATISPAGQEGQNAYTLTTAQITIPAKNATVTVAVESTKWMATGSNVFISANASGGKGATFQVTTISDATDAVLTFLQYPNDLAPTNTIANGSIVTPTGESPETGTTVSATLGAPFTIPQTTPTDSGVSLTLPNAGIWNITAFLNLVFSSDYNGAASENPITLTIQRTNNTPTALTNLVTYPITGTNPSSGSRVTWGVFPIQLAAYSSVNTTDQIGIFSSMQQALQAGTIQIASISLVAQQIG